MNSDPQRESGKFKLPSYNVVTTAYADIVEHNNNHTGLGVVFSALIKAMTESDDFVGPLDDSECQDPPERTLDHSIASYISAGFVEGDMDGDLQELLHSDTFMRIGLRLSPSGSYISTLWGEAVTSTELVPEIDNTTLFTEFLGTIKPEEIIIGNDQLIPNVLSGLQDRIINCHSSDIKRKIPEDQHYLLEMAVEEALRTFISIEPELKRLGLDSESLHKKFAKKPAGNGYLWLGSGATDEERAEKVAHDQYNSAHRIANVYETLESCVNYWGRGVLPEYIDARQYLLPPDKQGFGPADWHKDGGQSNWRHALDLVAKLMQSERTRSFGEEVKNGLFISIDAAIEDLNNSNASSAWSEEQLINLLNIRNMLTGLEYNAQMLLDYTDS